MYELRKLWRDEEGVQLVEYAMLAFFIAIACFVAIQQIGTTVAGFYSNIVSYL
jgi:Flp pilus assembly pilin Flp